MVLTERDLSALVVRPVLREEDARWNSLMSSHHYLGFRTLPGNSLKYVALLDGEWAADLSQDILGRLMCRWSFTRGKFVPPSEPTIRRALQKIDATEVDRIIGNWLMGQCSSEAIAIDGKTLRGSKGSKEKGIHLMAALIHKEGVVISQQAVDDKSNEITAVKPVSRGIRVLPDPCDITVGIQGAHSR